MRVLEVVLIVVLAASALALPLLPRRRAFTCSCLGLIAIATALHLTIDHARIQMIPAYLAVAGLIVALIVRLARPERRSGHRGWTFIGRAVGISSTAALLVIATVASTALPVWAMPQPTGNFAIGSRDIEMIDETRPESYTASDDDVRRIMTTVWYPVDQSAVESREPEGFPNDLGNSIALVFGIPAVLFGQASEVRTHSYADAPVSADRDSYPVVLFSPGIRSTRSQSMTMVEELVSNGFIVVGMDHPGTSANVTFPDGTSLSYDSSNESMSGEELYQYNLDHVEIRAQDASFALDELTALNADDPDGVLTGAFDLDKVGIAGHSYGGATALQALANDGRFKAGLSLEGGLWTTAASTGVTQPFFYIMSGDSFAAVVNHQTDYGYYQPGFESDLAATMTRSSSRIYFATVDGFAHQSFTDIPLVIPALFAKDKDPEHMVDITRSYVSAYFDEQLKGKESPLLDGPSARFPDVTFAIDPAHPFGA